MNILEQYKFDEKTIAFVEESERSLQQRFAELDDIAFYNQLKVLAAFKEHRLAERHFVQTTGYGYNDEGREVTDKIYATIFGAEAALVRSQFFSGTHAIVTALFGVLRPGDEMLSITNAPYATVKSAVDSPKASGTLKDFGISYRQINLLPGGIIDTPRVLSAIAPNTKMVYLQRSTGYDDRKAIGVKEIADIARKVHQINPDIVIFIDNCYGEFLEKEEPTQVGADLMAGSLIKNIGGGLAKTGGYIVGRKDLVEQCSQRLNTPVIGRETGSNYNYLRDILQGLFIAPKITNQALKNAVLVGRCFERLGYKVYPSAVDARSDIIQAVCLNSKEQVEAFCRAVQEISPVDSYVTPYAWDMPGYDSQVIMAAGCFVQGSSIEMSADSPMTEPYTVYFQGGLTYEHGKCAAMNILSHLKLVQ